MNSNTVTIKEANVVEMRSTFDIPVEQFQAGLEQRETNRQAMLKWISTTLKEGVDFGIIKGKKSLWKPGAEKIRGMLGVKQTYPSADKYIDAASGGIEVTQVILKCVLLSSTDIPLSEGLGARSLRQDNGDINKCVKMAGKSASIDATLNLCGLSEIFTQDLEDMFKDDKEDTPPPATAKVANPAKKETKEEPKITFDETPEDKLNKLIRSIEDPILKTTMEKFTEINDTNNLKQEWNEFVKMKNDKIIPHESFEIIKEVKDQLKQIIK